VTDIGFLERIGRVLSWVPRRLYRAVVISEQTRAHRRDERRAALLELRDSLGEVIVIERVSMGADPRMPRIEGAAARARVLATEADTPLRSAVTAFCDEFQAYRRRWTNNKPEDRERLHGTFQVAVEELGEVLRKDE
jgi:hypothetical protein